MFHCELHSLLEIYLYYYYIFGNELSFGPPCTLELGHKHINIDALRACDRINKQLSADKNLPRKRKDVINLFNNGCLKLSNRFTV
jgi:hypothetical protein